MGIARHRPSIVCCLTLLLICFASVRSGNCQTPLNWQDDFEDGGFEGWTTERGVFAIVNGSLVCQGVPRWPNLAVAYHESTGVFGNWAFDINGYTPSVWFIASSPNHRNLTGYRFARISENQTASFHLFKVVDGVETSLVSKDETSNEPTWNHIHIARDEESTFHININRSFIMRVTDIEIRTSDFFVFGGYSPGAVLDNVTVDPIEVPDVVNPVGLIAVTSVSVVFLVVVLEIRLRRREPS